MEITVTQENIDAANKDFEDNIYISGGHCPVEYALMDSGYVNPKIGSQHGTADNTISDKHEYFELSYALSRQIMNWDDHNIFIPGTYLISVK